MNTKSIVEEETNTNVGLGWSSGPVFRVVLSVMLGTIASLSVFGLGLSKFFGLAAGTIVAGIALAVIKYIDQRPTSA